MCGKRFRAFLLSLVMLLSLLSWGSAESAQTVTVTILESSDLHGTIASYDYMVDAPTEATGLTRLATLNAQEREKDPELLLVDCGDAMQDNLISLFNGDVLHPMVNAFNLLGYDVWTLGNHEFDYDFDMLERAISFFEGDVLIANAYQPDGSRWQAPYTIREVKGVKVGIFGIDAPHIDRWEATSPEHFNRMTFSTPMEETEKMVAELREQVDVLVGLVHYGREGEYGVEGMREVADAFPQVDAFLNGHAHKSFAELRENGVAMLEPGYKGAYLGKLTIPTSEDGRAPNAVSLNVYDLLEQGILQRETLIAE